MDRIGCLYAETVDQAFRNYKSAIVTTDDKACMKTFLEKVFEENMGKLYADFYYPVLSKEQQEAFCAGLSAEEMAMLGRFDGERQIYYQVDESELGFLFDITAREWLFSTFYTAEKKIMIWGNYHLEFPVFCETQEVLDFYLDLAKKRGMEWH